MRTWTPPRFGGVKGGCVVGGQTSFLQVPKEQHWITLVCFFCRNAKFEVYGWLLIRVLIVVEDLQQQAFIVVEDLQQQATQPSRILFCLHPFSHNQHACH